MSDRFWVFYEFYKNYVYEARKEKFTPKEIVELVDLPLTVVKPQIDFLQQKFLIRQYKKENIFSYQLWSFATDVLEQIMSLVIAHLGKSSNPAIQRILAKAKSQGYPKGYATIIEYSGKSKKEILPVIYKISKNYFDKLKVFENVTISPPKVSGNKVSNLRIRGNISKPYRKNKGKLPVTVFWPDETEHSQGKIPFTNKGVIDSSIVSKKTTLLGKYEVQINYQIFGYNPENKYADSEKISIFYQVA